jgi:hypothetical protein
LINGEISFNIALLRVTPASRSRKIEYKDEESATKHVQDGIKIMRDYVHKDWKLKQYQIWLTNVCKPLIQTTNKKG